MRSSNTKVAAGGAEAVRIAWLQDLDPFAVGGGAEMTDRAHIVAGIRRGYDVDIVGPSGDGKVVEMADAVVLSNVTGFDIKTFGALRDAGKPYIVFAHDYVGLCKWRLYYPMLGKCHVCYLKPRWLPILEEATLLVWLSPLHRDAWLFVYPELSDRPYVLVPSPVDVRLFHDLGQPRAGAVAVNSGIDFKGRDQVLAWARDHSDTPLTIVGQEPGVPLPTNVSLAPSVSPFEMNALYNKFETFVHLPQNPMPFDRTVAEAYLAGCTIVGNENVGALSWPFFKEGRDAVRVHLQQAPAQFWDAVEEAVTR